MHVKNTSGRGFTLIELLVSIAIMAFLISILLPTLSSARASARTVQCLSNLRQIGIGFSSYHVDYDGWLYPRLNAVYPTTWHGVIDRQIGGSGVGPYATTLMVFRCPDNDFDAMAPQIDGMYTGLAGNSTSVATAERIDQIQTPSRNVLVVEVNRRRSPAPGIANILYSTYGYANEQFLGHLNRSNVLLADMRAETIDDEHPLVHQYSWWKP